MMGMMTSILVGLNFGRSGEGRDEHGIIIIFILVSVDQLRSGYHGISYPHTDVMICLTGSETVPPLGMATTLWSIIHNNNEI